MPRVVDHAARRSEIVLALWGVIHERGLDGVSFRAVAEAAGVSIGRIQHYFASKEELIREGCTQMVVAAQSRYAELSRSGGPEHQLWTLVSGPVPSTRPQRLGAAVWYAYLAKSVAEPALREIIGAAIEDAGARAIRLLTTVRSGADGEGTDAAGAGHGAEARSRSEHEALALLALGDGLAQRVVVGAIDGQEALAALAEEFTRRGLTPGGILD